MVSYFRIHKGNLAPGDIAKASDIIQIQQNTKDMIQNVLEDLHERQGCILGSDENAFLLTPETTRAGRFVDQMNLAEGNDGKYISIREVDYRQPIRLSHSSLYSVIVKLQNKSEKDVSVTFELQDDQQRLVENKRATLELPAKTEPQEYEIIFDLAYYPTAHGVTKEDLENSNQEEESSTEKNQDSTYDTEYATKWKHLTIPHDNDNDTEGLDYGNTSDPTASSLGVSELYLVVKALNKNGFDVHQADGDYTWNDTDPTFGILMNINSSYGQLLEADAGSGYAPMDPAGDLYFKEIYTNAQSYKCEYGEALVGGEKVCLADTHLSLDGASSYGNVISYIYMDIDGHLRYKNSEPYIGAAPNIPIVDEPHLHIANIITYADSSLDPIIDQDDTTQEVRPRSHHERLRRLEKFARYTQDVAIPPRLKYSLSGNDWIDENPEEHIITNDKFNNEQASKLDALKNGEYAVTTDSEGNNVVLVSKAKSLSVPITLKSKNSGITETDKDKKITTIKSAQTSSYINKLAKNDIARAQAFAEIKDMKVDITNGIMTLDSKADDTTPTVATTDKEAKETEFFPWDDFKKNRPSSSKVEPTTRSYTVKSGKNGKNDWASEFPAMTFYADAQYKMKKLQIPVYKFKNCSAVKFIIYKRQNSNNQDNTVWLQKRIWTTDPYSLKKAKVKKGYQYMEDGFIINFGKKGLTLEKGQYVVIVLPIAKSGEGTVYVDTFKPDNSRDFCIRYYGAANASHFLLKTRYQEVWYNSAKAIIEKVVYDTKGSITSGTITWPDTTEPIKSIKALGNITKPKGTDYKLEVDAGGGWQEITLNKVTDIKTGKKSFRWRLTFTSDKKETPTLKYDSKKKYALKFEITRSAPNISGSGTGYNIDKNLCMTSIPIDGNNILREYLGDMNFALTDNKTSNFEFARIWANDVDEETLRIDLSGCDKIEPVYEMDSVTNKTTDKVKGYISTYSMHYVDLKLKDFNSGSVDYNNYTSDMEIDEHNLRLKLDTEYSYNDDNIKLININQFKLADESYKLELEEGKSGLGINLSQIPESESNVLIAKAQLDNYMNLAQYDAIKIGLTLNGSVDGTLAGLGIYISNTFEEEIPSNIKNEPDAGAVEIDTLPDLNSSQQETIDKYGNTIVKKFEPVNGTGEYVYYLSKWNSATEKWEWHLLHNIKSYELYELVNRGTNGGPLKITSENNGVNTYYEITINPKKINLQYAREIGLVALNDENKYSVTNVESIILNNFLTVQKDYYPVFSAKDNDSFTMVLSQADTVSKSLKSGSVSVVKTTDPPTSQVILNYDNSQSAEHRTAITTSGCNIAEFDTTSKSTENYNHIGIQMASDCFITKDMLELHLVQVDKETNVEKVIDKIRLPTNNYIYYPTESKKTINLIQVFKKLETNERFDKLVLYATPKFLTNAKSLKTVGNTEKTGVDGNKSISLFFGNISLYQARTIPMFHPRMRMKMYFDQGTESQRDHMEIRKIGVVVDYQ